MRRDLRLQLYDGDAGIAGDGTESRHLPTQNVGLRPPKNGGLRSSKPLYAILILKYVR